MAPGEPPGPFPMEREDTEEMPDHALIFLIFFEGTRRVIELRHIHIGAVLEYGKGEYYVN